MDNLHPIVYNTHPLKGKYKDKGEDTHGKRKTHERQ